MELKDVLLKRRSCRKFKETKISDEQIDYIMHAAMSGPSAMNKTPWEFFVITSDEKLKEIAASGRYCGYKCPLAIVVAANSKKFLPSPMEEFWVQDCSAATENILLAIADLGLGAVWCGVYPQKTPVANVQKVLGVKDNIIPLNIILVGYPDTELEPRDQYDENLVHKM
mgnify:CR=1 FL=1